MRRLLSLVPLLLLPFAARAGTYSLKDVIEIPAPEGALYPILSPQGDRVAFVAPGKIGWDVHVAAIGEKPRRVLADVVSGPDTWANALLGNPWSADGTRLALLTVAQAVFGIVVR